MAEVSRTMDPDWLSNSWLVADRPGGHAVLIDTGGPTAELHRRIEDEELTVDAILCTHHHHDHIAHNDEYRGRYGCPIHGHGAEHGLFGDLDETLVDGQELTFGDLRVRALHIPGHTVGQLAFVVDEERVFTGDTLFRRSVGGTRGPGHATFADLRRSLLEVLLKLPAGMPVHPGHMDETTIGGEAEHNPFLRAFTGRDPVLDRPCTALGRPATLLLEAPDYDGGTKCWVRWPSGREDVVPGSRVQAHEP